MVTPRTRARSLVDWWFRNPRSGRLVIAQFPNPPLWVYFAATITRRTFDPSGGVRSALAIVAGAALGWWAVAELGWGDSRFRRLLGAVVLVGLALTWERG